MNRTLGWARPWSRAAAALVVFLSLGALANACTEPPGDKYDDFLSRADRRPPALSDAEVVGRLVDLGGKEYLMNIRLNLNLDLKLKVLFTRWVLNQAGTEAEVSGEVRFETETLSATPITTFNTVMNSQGRMVITTGEVKVPPERSPVAGTEVIAQLTFVSTAISEDFICGRIEDDESKVLQPIQQTLKGTTFGARQIVDGVLPTDVPQSCPGQGSNDGGSASEPSAETGGEPSAETGSDASDASAPSDSSAGDVSSGD